MAAALTLAGQSIVLDYLSGILLLIEGPYFKGDVVAVGGVQGTVEEVGLRRTIVRDPSGTVHAVANGEIRVASNLTRMYGSGVVDVTGIDVADVDRVSALMNEVGQEVAADPSFAASMLETPRFVSIPAFTDLGATLRMSGRVRPTDRWTVEAELRRRLAMAFASADVHPSRRIVTAPAPAADPRPGDDRPLR